MVYAIHHASYNRTMRKLYVWQSRIGPFYITTNDEGQFYPYFDGEALGAYSRPEQAVNDLAGGHTFSITGGVDTATLGIPEDLAEWSRYSGNDLRGLSPE